MAYLCYGSGQDCEYIGGSGWYSLFALRPLRDGHTLGSSTASSRATTTSGSRQGSQTQQNLPHLAGTTYQGITPTATKSPSVTSSKGRTTPVVQQNPLQAFLDVRLIGIRAILGTILLVLGVIGFIVLARRM